MPALIFWRSYFAFADIVSFSNQPVAVLNANAQE